MVQPLVDKLKIDQSANEMNLLKPTIYYLPRFSQAEHINCSTEERVSFKTIENKLLLQTCPKILKNCEMQGTCEIQLSKKSHLITIDKKNDNGERTFRFADTKICKFGMGATADSKKTYKRMCIEPFYSVAADLSIYNLGDVIYLPALKNLKLPNGEKHSGYLIVRDSGQLVKGIGRFDFFTGHFGMSKKNPLFNLGFSDDNKKIEYRLVENAEAEQVRYARRFPGLK